MFTQEEREGLITALKEAGIKTHHRWKDETLAKHALELGLIEETEESKPEKKPKKAKSEDLNMQAIYEKLFYQIMDGDQRAIIRQYMGLNTKGQSVTHVLRQLMDDLSGESRAHVFNMIKNIDPDYQFDQ